MSMSFLQELNGAGSHNTLVPIIIDEESNSKRLVQVCFSPSTENVFAELSISNLHVPCHQLLKNAPIPGILNLGAPYQSQPSFPDRNRLVSGFSSPPARVVLSCLAHKRDALC